MSSPEGFPLGAAGRRLAEIARASIEHGLRTGESLPLDLDSEPAALRCPGATFVTLLRAGDLRGCIGDLEGDRSLAESAALNAWKAAASDPRFPPMEPRELADLEVHVSVLGPREPIPMESEDDLVRQLRPGIDGLVLVEGSHRGTFLPSVWEGLPDPRRFVRELKRKMGLPAEYWSPRLEAQRYTVESFSA